MYRNLRHSCLFLAALAGSTMMGESVNGQELFNRVSNDASRVIQLRNGGRAKQFNPLGAVGEKVQRVVNEARNSKPVVAFDEINPPAILAGSGNRQPAAAISSPPAPTIHIQQPPQVSQIDLQHPPEPQTAKLIQPRSPQIQVPSQPASWAKAPVSGASPVTRNLSIPSVTTEIVAPEYVNVGEMANIKIKIANQGTTAINGLELKAIVAGSSKVNPVGGVIQEGTCSFEINSLKPGERRNLVIEVTPEEKQRVEIDTQLVVAKRGQIAVGVRQPELVLSVTGPDEGIVGASTTHLVTISNNGDGIARDVRLEANFPEELKFLKQVGLSKPKTLLPGQKMQVEVLSVPQAPGMTGLTFVATGKGSKTDPTKAELRVAQPELRIATVGPDMNFVERDGIYTITIDNAGEVDVNNVQVEFAIPGGVKVNTISRPAKMDARRNTLTWNFEKIDAATQQVIQIKSIANEEGEKISSITIDSDETTEKTISLTTMIVTRADLSIRMKTVGGPVQVGTPTDFIVYIENRGSNMANESQIEIQLPEGLRPSRPEEGIVDKAANVVKFSDANLKPGETREFKFSALAVSEGEQIVRSMLRAEGSEQRIIAENSVFVYQPTQARVSESLTPAFTR